MLVGGGGGDVSVGLVFDCAYNYEYREEYQQAGNTRVTLRVFRFRRAELQAYE